MAKQLKKFNGEKVIYVPKAGSLLCGILRYQTKRVNSMSQPNEGRYAIINQNMEIPITVNGKNRVAFNKINMTLTARV